MIESHLYSLVCLGSLTFPLQKSRLHQENLLAYSKAKDNLSLSFCFLGLWKKQLQCLWFMPLLIMLWWFEVV